MGKRANTEQKHIKYFVGYDSKECYSENRDVSAAAMTKATYICKKLNEIGYCVDIISNAASKNDSGIYRSHKYSISNLNTLFITPSVGNRGRLKRIANRFLSNIWLFLYGIIHIKKNETILVYHGLRKENVILALKKLKSLCLVLEVEELYQNVGKLGSRTVQLENRVIRCADKYIAITEELNALINKTGKAYCILNGTYEYIGKKTLTGEGKKKLVYAGTFNAEKGGVYKAVDVMEKLPDDYRLAVLGFGSEAEIAAVKDYILNRKDRRENIEYVGLLRGQEFIDYLKECDIGLSTQNSHGDYNDTSFPSKILTYICCGLKVVSVRIPVVENSQISACVSMYDDGNIDNLAEAIISAQSSSADCEEIINRLDIEFERQLGLLIGTC